MQLNHYLNHHIGTPRIAIWPRTRVRGAMKDVWKTLLHSIQSKETSGGELRAGQEFQFETACGDSLEGEVLLYRPPFHLGLMVRNLNDAAMIVEIEPGRDEHHTASYLLSTHGVPKTTTEQIQNRWQGLLNEIFPLGENQT